MPVDVSQFSGKTYSIMTRQGCLSIDDDGDGAPVVLLPPGEGPGQQWQLVDAGGGQCSIRSTSSEKALAVQDASTENYAPVVQSTFSGANNQLWTLENADGGAYQILSVNSGKALGMSLLRIYPPRVAQVDSDRGEQWILQQV